MIELEISCAENKTENNFSFNGLTASEIKTTFAYDLNYLQRLQVFKCEAFSCKKN